jgi:hypothetical protein
MHYCSIDGCNELNAVQRPFGTFGALTLTHEGSAVILKQEEKTIHLLAELEDYSCIVSNALMKLDRNQDNIKLCGFAIPVCHKIGLKKIFKENIHAPTHRPRMGRALTCHPLSRPTMGCF